MGSFPCIRRIGRIGCPSSSNGSVRDVFEGELGDREMMGVGVERLERIAESQPKLPLDGATRSTTGSPD